MPKQKTRKSILKRIKVTASGKLLRRHQLAAGTHRRKKTKGALGRYKKLMPFAKRETKALKRALGI